MLTVESPRDTGSNPSLINNFLLSLRKALDWFITVAHFTWVSHSAFHCPSCVPEVLILCTQVTAFLMPSTLITFHASLDFYLAQIDKELLGKEAAGRWHVLVSLEDIPEVSRAIVFLPWHLLSLEAYLCLQWVMLKPGILAANSRRTGERLYLSWTNI